MRRTIVTRTAVAILIGAAVTPVAVAAAQDGATQAPDRVRRPAQGTDQAPVVLRRDGDSAVPFDPVIRAGREPVLRRDGSKAVAFGADRPATSPNDGFHWGDALIGATGTLGLIVLAAVSLLLITRKRPARRLAQRRAQGALG